MLRPDLYDSTNLKNAVGQIMRMCKDSELSYYEDNPKEKEQVPRTDEEVENLLATRRSLFVDPFKREKQQDDYHMTDLQKAPAPKKRFPKPSYLLVNANNALVSSFTHFSKKEMKAERTNWVTLTFHVRQPNWFENMKIIYNDAKTDLEKLINFIQRKSEGSKLEVSNVNAKTNNQVEFEDFVIAEREFVYCEKNLKQWSNKFDIELKRDSPIRHAVQAFQSRMGFECKDHLGYSFGLFFDECLCSNESVPKQVVLDCTPVDYKIIEKADIFVTNFYVMNLNRRFREEIVTTLYEVYMRDRTAQVHQEVTRLQGNTPKGQQETSRMQNMAAAYSVPKPENILSHFHRDQQGSTRVMRNTETPEPQCVSGDAGRTPQNHSITEQQLRKSLVFANANMS